ncbi:hypothetical protein [Streptacidiphilus anmyonensis]|uniref:hypothetical protein n=1 Tax=Streptacidiphilus anmyonensis TaxID=405782 RepID=UPI0005A8B98E|nr:hypothetical protein [Streptacidiphilus anmyonensis]
MSQLPVVRPGQQVVTRSDGKGGLTVDVETMSGRTFAVSALVGGYVLDGRLLMDALGSLKMPGSWFQVWCKMVAAQDARDRKTVEEARKSPKGYIRISQRVLQERCNLSAASVSEASQFYTHIGWMRVAKRGLVQLNPWLTAAGKSGEQEKWQAEWNAAGGPACVIPAPDYPTVWRQMRLVAKKEAEAARRGQPVVQLRVKRLPAKKASA